MSATGSNAKFLYSIKILIFLNTVGRKGRGPGQFVDLPVIVPNDNVRLIDTNTRSLYEFDDDFTLRNSHSLPAELYLNIFWPPLAFNEHIIVTGNGVRYPINDDRYFTHYKSLFLLDDEYNLIDNFYDWNDIYFERSYDAYTKTRSGVNLTKGPDNTFYANQKATHIIDQFDSGFNIIHSFGLKPRYYRTPPENVSFDEIQRSLEHFIEYNIETTNIENIHFDEKKNHVYLSYTNSTKESMTRRDWTLGQQYLQVYDENYDCIFGDRIPGIFSFADNGNIYIRTAETPDYFSLSIFRLKERMDK